MDMAVPEAPKLARPSGLCATTSQIRQRFDQMTTQFGRGEAEAIVLAQELNADTLILDDATARKTATGMGQRIIGLLGLLVFAKECRVIETSRPLMDDLLRAGFFVEPLLYRTVLRAAGEEPPE
jgi:predicted nucleic acid-binding protein